jgi:TetR/AcrR family transcriptional repressor of nem operon
MMAILPRSASMNAKAEKKERSHQSILASAARLVREKGISGAGVAEVMKGAALTVGGFYAHFASKDALVDETLRRSNKSLRESLFARLDGKPQADRADVILKRYLSAEHRDGGAPDCPMPAVLGEVGTTAPQHRAVLAEQVEVMVDGLAHRLPAGGIVPRRALAIGLLALMYGGLSLARALKGSDLSDEVLRACRALGVAAAGGKAERT